MMPTLEVRIVIVQEDKGFVALIAYKRRKQRKKKSKSAFDANLSWLMGDLIISNVSIQKFLMIWLNTWDFDYVFCYIIIFEDEMMQRRLDNLCIVSFLDSWVSFVQPIILAFLIAAIKMFSKYLCFGKTMKGLIGSKIISWEILHFFLIVNFYIRLRSIIFDNGIGILSKHSYSFHHEFCQFETFLEPFWMSF